MPAFVFVRFKANYLGKMNSPITKIFFFHMVLIWEKDLMLFKNMEICQLLSFTSYTNSGKEKFVWEKD